MLKWTLVIMGMGAIAAGAYVERQRLMALLPQQTAVADVVKVRPPQPVRVTRVNFGRQQSQSVYTGTVRPRYETSLGFRVGGKMLERLVAVGDTVSKGQTLARLDDTDARLEVEANEAEVLAAETELKRATAEVTRSRKLLAQGFATRAAFDRATAITAEAQARLDRALRARDLAANRLQYMTLTSDRDGVVTAERAEVGQVVNGGQPIVSVARLDALDVVFALPEQKRTELEGTSATATLLEGGQKSYALSLRDVSPDVDATTRTYRVRMGLMAADASITLGRTATVTFDGAAPNPVAVLPLAAVMNEGSGASVWRLAPDQTRVERVPVTVEALDGEVATVRDGLKEGDLVVSLGAHKIDAARPVRVVETTTVSLSQ